MKQFLGGLFFVAGTVAAQPVVEGVANTASFANLALPNGALAQGGMFAVLGRGLGPAQLALVNAFPLPLELGGTSVRVTVGGTTVDCILIFSIATQVAAILPSNTPLGEGTVRVTFGGQTSAAFAVRVVRSSFGIFALNQGGSGPGIFTDTNFAVNTLVQAAAPGSLWFIWGTGLGPVAGDERGGALPGDQPAFDVTVMVGGKRATVTYRGRSGCCAGIDQILFEVPEGVVGCHVPVVVLAGGVPSNWVTMSIAAEGALCSDATGLRAADLAAAQTGGGLALGNVVVSRSVARIASGTGAALTSATDTISGVFSRFDLRQLLSTQSVTSVANIGACTVYQFRGTEGAFADPVPGSALDAGAQLTLTGPRGSRTAPRRADGLYANRLGGSSLQIPGLPGGGDTSFLAAGAYTLAGPGGGSVGPFSVGFTIGAALVPANLGSPDEIPRNRPLVLRWTGGGDDFAVASGYSVVAAARAGAGFVCRERAAAGALTVPVEVLSSLPASSSTGPGTVSVLSLGSQSVPVRFEAQGIAGGQVSHTNVTSTAVVYQ